MSTEFKAVIPERAVEIMRAWAFHPWPMSVRDGIDVCTSLGSTGGPRDPASFASDMRDRLFGNGALTLSSSVPGAQPVRTACRAAQGALPAAGPCRLPRRTGALPAAGPHRSARRMGLRPEGRPAAR